MTEKTHSLRNGIFCVLVFLACYVAAWPVAQMGFVDDWSYIKTAQVFAQTGHIVYNGWAAPILGWMIPWGALFIKLFGFSFMAVKLSTLPLAVGTLLLFHGVLRRFEISPRNAVIGTLTLGLSPLFLPLSASFMTDIPGLFVIVLCLYCCQRAVVAESDRAAIGWLAAAALSNVVGGTARQVAWLGILVMVPCTGCLLQKRRRVLAASAALWVLGGVAVWYCMRWFATQPNMVALPGLPKIPHSAPELIARLILWADLFGALILCVLLVVSPVLSAWLHKFGKRGDHFLALLCFGLLPLLLARLLLGNLDIVWPPHVLFTELSMRKDASLVWFNEIHTLFLPRYCQIGISLVLIAALLGLIFTLHDEGVAWIRVMDSGRAGRAFWLLVPFFLCYTALLVLLIPNYMFFDRYLLGVMPFCLAGAILLYQRYVGPELPVISVLFLIVFSLFAVAGTHDWFAWQRARLAAIQEIRAAGVKRTEIQGGDEYDGWTQLEQSGLLGTQQSRDLSARAGEQVADSSSKSDCSYWLLSVLPALKPRYSVAVGPFRCYLPSRFSAVHYRAWLPPFERTVEVQRVPQNTGEVRH